MSAVLTSNMTSKGQVTIPAALRQRFGKDDAVTAKQCEAARQLVDGGKRLMVSKTVLLELESVLRGAYDVAPPVMQEVFLHLLSLNHIDIEDRVAVQSAVTALGQGFDFADALHHASYRSCSSVATFDDKGFARRAKKAGFKPAVVVPQA